MSREDNPSPTLIGVFLVVGIVTVIAMSLFLYSCITSLPKYHEVPPMVIDTVPIYSLNFGQTVQGAFLLGTGTINSESVYYCFEKRSDGGFVLSHVPTDQSIIYMDSTNDTAYITVSTMDSVTCREDQKDAECAKKYTWRKSYAIHVPPNTVRKEFDGNP
jgi:hypothetical protein